MVFVSDDEGDANFDGGDEFLDEELFFTGTVMVLPALVVDVGRLFIGLVSDLAGGIRVV